MFASAFFVAVCVVAAIGPDTVVVTPPHFVDALRPWIAHRTAQGHRLAFVSNAGSAEEIREGIRHHARAGRLRFVLLIGDAEPAAVRDPWIRARCVPAFMAKATVNVRWRSTPELPTDSWYADLNDDGVPDVAIGRLPADSPEELAAMVSKILAYETGPAPGSWSRRINFVAGIGGFGPLIEPILELATKKFLTDGIPPEYETTMTYGSWRSPFFPSPAQFHEATINSLNEGCLFWVYIGHGYPYQLDRVRVPGQTYHILSTSDMHKLNNRHGPPIAVLLACYTGAYDQPYDCLAEHLVRAPGGPVAVLAGSRVTMPYGMAVFGSGLMTEYFHRRPETLGEVILNAKRYLANDAPQGTDRKLIDLLAKAISPNPQLLREERLEHVLLFNLLGDPLMRLHHPRAIELQTEDRAMAGGHLEIRGDSPLAGRARIELVNRRDRLRDPSPKRHRYDPSPEAQSAFNATYGRANDRLWSSRQVDIQRGPFLTALKIPPEARGACHVNIFLEDASGGEFALGSRDILIVPPKSNALPAQASLKDTNPVDPGPASQSILRR
jgi:hypothetical protein